MGLFGADARMKRIYGKAAPLMVDVARLQLIPGPPPSIELQLLPDTFGLVVIGFSFDGRDSFGATAAGLGAKS